MKSSSLLLKPLTLKYRILYKIWNFWPPFLGAGIWIKDFSFNFTWVDVCLKKRWWNTNVVGVQFGGSIYAMADPFLMMILLHHLSDDYVIWDKAATVLFLKPGKTNLHARFEITEAMMNHIKNEVVSGNGRYDWTTTIQIKDETGLVVADVEKVIYLRAKNKPRS